MRMSLPRFAALGAVLMAGLLSASCASTTAIVAASGPNPQVPGFATARVQFVEGSPNLNLTFNCVDVYVDNRLVFKGLNYPTFPGVVINPSPPTCFFNGPVTPFIAIPAGSHDIKFVQAGSLAPVFLDQILTFAAGSKIAVVAMGDAAYGTTNFAVWKLPVYTTPAGARAVSVLNASPNARGTIDFWYNCPIAGQCGDGATATEGTEIAGTISLGTPDALPNSWANNTLLKSSGTGRYCFGAYPGGSPTLLPYNNGAGPPNATIPFGTASDPRNALCLTATPADAQSIAGGSDNNFFVIDAPSVAPRVPANGPSAVLRVPDANG